MGSNPDLCPLAFLLWSSSDLSMPQFPYLQNRGKGLLEPEWAELGNTCAYIHVICVSVHARLFLYRSTQTE